MWTKSLLTRTNFCDIVIMRRNIGSGLERTVPFLYAYFPMWLLLSTHRDTFSEKMKKDCFGFGENELR